MKKIIIIGIIIALCTACGTSSSVDKAMSQIEKSIAKIEKNKGNMTEDDWNNFQKEVEEPLKVIYEALESDKVGFTQKLKILTLTAKWTTAVAEAGFLEIGKDIDFDSENFKEEIENAIKEFEGLTPKTDESEIED